MAVDHDNKTDENEGSVGIGMFLDRARLSAAVAYLEG